jgi:thioredoxin-dependent peroxiredoxin
MAVIEEGKKAPTFSLPDQNGTVHNLKDYAGRPVVVYFYPKDDTPGCTTEACGFRDALPDFSKLRIPVLGISVLDSDSKAKFAKKHSLNFSLLADEDHTVAEKYGAWQERSMYGRKFMGIARISYLIDKDGKVAKRWDKVSPATHPQEVLEAAKAL